VNDLTRDEAVALCRLANQRIEHIQEHIVGAGGHIGTIMRRRFSDEIDLLTEAANKLSVQHDIDEDDLYADP
jgi:hypothetical protein